MIVITLFAWGAWVITLLTYPNGMNDTHLMGYMIILIIMCLSLWISLTTYMEYVRSNNHVRQIGGRVGERLRWIYRVYFDFE